MIDNIIGVPAIAELVGQMAQLTQGVMQMPGKAPVPAMPAPSPLLGFGS